MGHYNYDLDYPEGKFAEHLVKDLLGGERGPIEVKRQWLVTETGKLAIEYEYRGRPSGISTSKATWWALVLDERQFAHEMIIFIKTSRLKEMAREIYKRDGAKTGGDKRRAKMVCIPLEDIIRYNPEVTQPDMI